MTSAGTTFRTVILHSNHPDRAGEELQFLAQTVHVRIDGVEFFIRVFRDRDVAFTTGQQVTDGGKIIHRQLTLYKDYADLIADTITDLTAILDGKIPASLTTQAREAMDPTKPALGLISWGGDTCQPEPPKPVTTSEPDPGGSQ